MSKMFESQNLLSYEIEELQNKLNIYLPLSEQHGSIDADKPTDTPDISVNRPERKHRLLQFIALLCLFSVLGVAVPSICEANNPMPIPDPNDDYMYGRGAGGPGLVGWFIENVLGWVILVVAILGGLGMLLEGNNNKDKVGGALVLGFIGMLGYAFFFA